jgi:hypothetical protein
MGNRYLLNRDFLEPDRDQRSDIEGRTGKTRGDSRFCGEHRSLRSHHGQHSNPFSRYPGLHISILTGTYFVYTVRYFLSTVPYALKSFLSQHWYTLLIYGSYVVRHHVPRY